MTGVPLDELIESRKSALKVEEVAAILNVSSRLIYQLVAIGEIPHFKVGKVVRFEPKALSDWLRDRLKSSGKERTYKHRLGMAQTGAPIMHAFEDIWRSPLLPKKLRAT
jgi:excisionase family DNA binding protein